MSVYAIGLVAVYASDPDKVSRVNLEHLKKGVFALVFGGLFFIMQLDDNFDYYKICAGCMHGLVGYAVYELWQTVSTPDRKKNDLISSSSMYV